MSARWTDGLSGSHLRLVRANLLADYIANTRLLLKLGNVAFADRVATGDRGLIAGATDRPSFGAPYALLHSWHDGLLELDANLAAVARRLIDRPPDQWEAREASLCRQLSNFGWLAAERPDPEWVAFRSLASFAAAQNQQELTMLLGLVQERSPRTIVEIGTARGGTFVGLMQVAPPNATLISIDLPGAPNCGGQTHGERTLLEQMRTPGQHIEWIVGDSHSGDAHRSLQRVLDHRSIDFLLIDGDHSYSGVKADIRDYGRLVSDDGLIALHDIGVFSKDWGPQAGVGELWQELAAVYPNTEIIDSGGSWPAHPRSPRPAWGIGVLSGADRSSFAS